MSTKDKFNFIDEIGSGTYGKVHEVRDKATNASFALKVMWHQGDVTLHKKEIDIMVTLKHANIVKYYDHFYDDNFTYIQMQLCLCNLKQLIKLKSKSFTKSRDPIIIGRSEYFISWHLIAEIVEGLNYLHTLQPNPIIHRDLKPKNILISDGSDGSFVKLCDFGLSKEHLISSHTSNVGTFRYMAPEVIKGKHYNTKSDVYSLAVVAFKIMGFAYSSQLNLEQWKNRLDHLKGEIGDSSEVRKNMKKFLELIAKCLLITSEDYQKRLSCDEFKYLFNGLQLDYLNEFELDNQKETNENLSKIFHKIYMTKPIQKEPLDQNLFQNMSYLTSDPLEQILDELSMLDKQIDQDIQKRSEAPTMSPLEEYVASLTPGTSRQNTLDRPSSSSSISSTSSYTSSIMSSRESIQDMISRLVCKICYDREVEVVFLPCGHQIACNQCALELSVCPICDKMIASTVRTIFTKSEPNTSTEYANIPRQDDMDMFHFPSESYSDTDEIHDEVEQTSHNMNQLDEMHGINEFSVNTLVNWAHDLGDFEDKYANGIHLNALIDCSIACSDHMSSIHLACTRRWRSCSF